MLSVSSFYILKTKKYSIWGQHDATYWQYSPEMVHGVSVDVVFFFHSQRSPSNEFSQHFANSRNVKFSSNWTLQMEMLSKIVDRYHHLNMVHEESAESNISTSAD